MNSKMRIFLILFFSYIVARFLAKNAFIANSSRINAAFFSKIPAYVSSLFVNRQKVDFVKIERLPNSALTHISKGVYAKEDENGKFVYIRLTNDMEFDEKIFLIDGKQVKVRFPKSSIK